MNLANLIIKDLILIGEKTDTKENAVGVLAQKITEVFPRLDKNDIINKIMDRENISTTTLPNGVAIPHARIENFNDIFVSVLVPESPIKDGDDLIRIIFLTLTDLTKSNLYLNVLSSIAKICHEDANIQLLINSHSKEEFIKQVHAFDVAVKKVIYAKDIMASPPLFLFPESTVKEALDLMSKHQLEYIPVCDENQKLLGEVCVRDILTIGFPHYTQMLTNLKFLSSLEPLEDLLKHESIIKLESIMRKPSIFISPDSVIIEVMFQFIKNNHRRCFPVVDDDRCIGVISCMDIITKFLRV